MLILLIVEIVAIIARLRLISNPRALNPKPYTLISNLRVPALRFEARKRFEFALKNRRKPGRCTEPWMQGKIWASDFSGLGFRV